MAISVVQRKVTQGSSGTLTLAYTSNVTANNTLLVVAIQASSISAPSTPTDSQGNTFTQVASSVGSSPSLGMGVYTAQAASSAADTISIATGNHQLGLHIYEVSGLAASNSFDALSTRATSSTSPTSNSITTRDANELLIGIFGSSSTVAPTWSVGTNYLNGQADTATGVFGYTEERIVSATGSYTAAATESGSNGTQAAWIVGFGDTAISGGGSTAHNLSITGVGS